MKKLNLDDVKIYPRQDPAGMLSCIKDLPAQVRQAWRQVAAFQLPPEYKTIDKIVVLGMGGSAIGGDLLKDLTAAELKVPIIVYRDYGLPAYVNERTLVIASSHSGNTEETLSGFEPALKTLSPKLAVTGGGRLQEMAAAHNIPLFKIDYASQPRAALGYSLIPMLGVLANLGLIGDKSKDVAETVTLLEKMVTEFDEKSPQVSNPAKRLAEKLHGHLPVVYGAGIAATVARRWKTQLNENAKAWAFSEVFPELNHNAVVGYSFPPEVAGEIRVVMLRAASLHRRVGLRYEVTAELLEKAGVNYEYVDSRGKSNLAQMMSLVMIGDFASYYLGILNGIDPTPIPTVGYLKERLAKG
jgi:glucose/mannose-6-phosphate isomerase